MTYLALHDTLYTWLNKHIGELSSEEASGFKVFADALTKPFLTICGNSGNQNAQYALGCIQSANRSEHRGDEAPKPWTKCIDLGTSEPIDVVDRGIVDSAAAVIETLKNAAAAAGQLLSLSGVVNTPPPPPVVQPQM